MNNSKRNNTSGAQTAQKHKVFNFGSICRGNNADEKELYWFTHQDHDCNVSEGWIPIGFQASLPCGDENLFLETRMGATGPEFQVSWQTARNTFLHHEFGGFEVIAEWSEDPDRQWANVLGFFEKKGNALSEEDLDYLDADPFILFGIDNPITQKALGKMENTPYLTCKSNKPDLVEWRRYMNADLVGDDKHVWVIEAMAETQLPQPWTCYKGLGSIVCFLNYETKDVTWKHPLVDYFTQLLDFCRCAQPEEIQKVRTSRLIWMYESSMMVARGHIQPLISPEFVEQFADIFDVDIKSEPFLVRSLKHFLKTFGLDYRTSKDDIDLNKIKLCTETLNQDRESNAIMHETWREALFSSVDFDINLLQEGKVQCVETGNTALCFCIECKDYFSLAAFDKVHQKANRKQHTPFKLIPCCMYPDLPARVQCPYTKKFLSHEAYAMEHIKTLPPEAFKQKPMVIEYGKQSAEWKGNRAAEMEAKEKKRRDAKAARQLNEDLMGITQDDDSSSKDGGESAGLGSAKSSLKAPTDVEEFASALGTDWHPFYDAKGIKFFFNFSTGESLRHEPTTTPRGEKNDGGGEQENHYSSSIRKSLKNPNGTSQSQQAGGVESGGAPISTTSLVHHPRQMRPPYRDRDHPEEIQRSKNPENLKPLEDSLPQDLAKKLKGRY